MLLKFLTVLVMALWMSPILAQTSETPPAESSSPSAEAPAESSSPSAEAPRERPEGSDLGSSSEPGRYPGLSEIAPFAPASPSATEVIVDALSDASETCSAITQSEYMVDCLAYELAVIAREMPNTGDYREARLAIKNAADKLRVLARENADPVLKPTSFKRVGKGRKSTRRRLTPINSARRGGIGEQAAAIIAEAETVLLRSADSSDARRVHYEQISAALGSNKLLLRSL